MISRDKQSTCIWLITVACLAVSAGIVLLSDVAGWLSAIAAARYAAIAGTLALLSILAVSVALHFFLPRGFRILQGVVTAVSLVCTTVVGGGWVCVTAGPFTIAGAVIQMSVEHASWLTAIAMVVGFPTLYGCARLGVQLEQSGRFGQ